MKKGLLFLLALATCLPLSAGIEDFVPLDFSYCGYRASEVPIPDVKAAVFVEWGDGDQSERIQRAIDHLSSLPQDAEGRRGAVLLGKGRFYLSKPLRINASGVVLRGCGPDSTVLVKQGSDRGALLYLEGSGRWVLADTVKVRAEVVQAGSFSLPSDKILPAGTQLLIVRPSEEAWIKSIGCQSFGGDGWLGWKSGDADVRWDRTVTGYDNGSLTLDAPLSMPLDPRWGESYAIIYSWPGRIGECGVENLSLEAEVKGDNPKDEDHCWTGISVSGARDCWVRKVNFRHFAGSATVLLETASRITVEDCISEEPVSENAGLRRRTFCTYGGQTLFQRCLSMRGINDFAVGYAAPGPNAFVQCDSEESLGFSGPVGPWATGVLFDGVNIDGNNLVFRNLGQEKQGCGWNAGCSLFWQCTASRIDCFSPSEDCRNYCYGSWGAFDGNGEWGGVNSHVLPRSIYYHLLEKRLGRECDSRILPRSYSSTTSPTIEQAQELAAATFEPRLTLRMWIERQDFSASTDPSSLLPVDRLRPAVPVKTPTPRKFGITRGKITADGALLVGSRVSVPWWNGRLRPKQIISAQTAITRFVPDREGRGLTDRIDSVVTGMKRRGVLVVDQNYGLWYDRRRDDHERIRRADGDAWGPFYEQPFARTGKGTAWDGLSRYDLTRPNPWYWSRLREFADKGAAEGMLLFNENYFQHNILEAGAHWVDCPWRDVNNVNGTPFPEPVPFSGDKRIYMAEMFYDVSDPHLRELHRSYIRMCLEELADRPNVVQLTSAEYTGPLHFTRFWVDEAAAWERETGKDAMIALSCTKDVQDAILESDSGAAVDIIDIRYWRYNEHGLYAPGGGLNMAPRQFARKIPVGRSGFAETYRAVAEYRQKYPGKAVTCAGAGWAVLMAGGSCPDVRVSDAEFLRDVVEMDPALDGRDGIYSLEKAGVGAVVYPVKKAAVQLELPKGRYRLKSVDTRTGEVRTLRKITSKGAVSLDVEPHRVLWIDALR